MHWKLSRRTALIAALVLAIASVSAVTVAAAHRGGQHRLDPDAAGRTRSLAHV